MMENPEEILKECLEKVAKEQNYDSSQTSIKGFSSEGANYTSFLYLVTLQAPEKEDIKIFAKVAAVGEKMRSMAPFKIYETESLFYNSLLKTYKQLEVKKNIPEEHKLVTPKFYGGSDEFLKETVVLEDLTAKGYTTHDRFKSIDWEYASKSLENLAKLHALSIAFAEDDPEGFENMGVVKGRPDFEQMITFVENIIKNAIQVTREENRDRLSKFMNDLVKEKDFDKFYRHYRRPVIVHGDYRPSNLMHRTVDGKLEVLSVDYQTVFIGNPIIDIMYFIFNGSDKKFRDQHFKQCLEHYYGELCKALRRFGLDPEEVYSRDDYEYELKEILPVGLVLSMLCLLIVTVEKEEAPKVGQTSTVDDFAINPNTLYTERLNEIVDDYIDMGIL